MAAKRHLHEHNRTVARKNTCYRICMNGVRESFRFFNSDLQSSLETLESFWKLFCRWYNLVIDSVFQFNFGK